ncbi:MAG: response regulator [Thermoproteota archaeon]|nr:response regulator [Thermoproteota archaeon]
MLKPKSILKILIAEDNAETASLYRKVLTDRGHVVNLAQTSEKCLEIYSERLYGIQSNTFANSHIQPFDAVILDYNLPDRNGLEVAKEILAINSHQRIIFVSGYVKDTLSRSINELNMPVEILQKPLSNQVLIDIVEETEIYDELRKFKIDVSAFKDAGFRHESLKKMINVLGERKDHVKPHIS